MNATITNIDQARKLISTSVDDLKSSLACSSYSLDVLVRAVGYCKARGEITKETLLRAQINRQRKSAS